MALDKNVTNLKPPHMGYFYVSENNILNNLYQVNQQQYKKYRQHIKKYTIKANKKTNPYLNDTGNTVCHKENENEHSKNSGKLYKNNTHKVKKN
jgi:hypothetical protein